MLDCNSKKLKATSNLVLANSNLILFQKRCVQQLFEQLVTVLSSLKIKLDLLIFPGGISVIKF